MLQQHLGALTMCTFAPDGGSIYGTGKLDRTVVDPQMPPCPDINPISKAEFEARSRPSFRSGYSDGRIADDRWRMTAADEAYSTAINRYCGELQKTIEERVANRKVHLKTILQD